MNNNTTVDAHAQLIKANDDIAHDLIPAMVYLGVLMLVGLVGNSLVCFVFFFRLRMTTQDCLIIALAVFDLLSCFIAMPTEIVDMRYFLMFDNEFACRLLRFIIHYCAFASILTLVIIALDRYMKVCHPLQRQMSLKNVKIALLFILLVALVFAFPATILYGTRSTEVDNISIPGHDCSINDHVKETVYPMVYNMVLFVAFFFVLVMLTVIYIRIWREMKRHRIYMARNSVAGESRLYLSSASEMSSACEFPAPRSGSGRRSTLPVENGHDDVFVGSERSSSRRKKTERRESGCSGSDSGTEHKLPSVHSDTTFCEGEQELKDFDDDQQELTHAMDSQSSGDVEKQFQNGQDIPVQGLTKTNASARIGPQDSGDIEKQFQNGQDIPVHEQGLTRANASARVGPQDSEDVEKQFHSGQDIPTDSELARHLKTQASNGTLPSGVPAEKTVSVLDETVKGDISIPSNSCPNSEDSAKNVKQNEGVCQSDSKDILSDDSDSVKQNCFLQESVRDNNSDVKAELIALNDIRHTDSTNRDQTEQISISRMDDTGGDASRRPSCDCNVDSEEDSVRVGSEGQSALKNCKKSVDGACVDSASNSTPPLPSETPEDSDTPIPNHEAEARTRSEEGIHNGDIPPPRSSQPENNDLRNAVTDMAMVSKRKVTKSKSVSELKSHKATVIAMSVTVVFFLSFVPHLSLITVRTLNTDFDRSLRGAGLVLYNIFLRSYFINSVTNPIIYGVLNSRFRVECLYVFRQIVSCGKRTT